MAKRTPAQAKEVQQRVKRVHHALESYDGDSLVDLLADIRHYCDANNLDFYNLDRIAYEHYLEER